MFWLICKVVSITYAMPVRSKRSLARKLTGFFLATLSISTTGSGAEPHPLEPQFKLVDDGKVTLHSPLISEVSGIAPSLIDPTYLWMVNDSGSPAEIYLLETNGNFRGKVTLQGVPNRDWEELAIFSKSGISYLLVADTGDNNATRKDCTLTAIRDN